MSELRTRSARAFCKSSINPLGSRAVLGSAPANSWSRTASGIRGSLRRGMGGLLRSDHAQPRTKFPTVPYEPGLNRTYLDLATHYGTAILPTRTRKPRDKAKVEVAVLVVERWILARLRNRRFFSLAELNRAIWELVADLNARPMRRLGVSRRDLFLELDQPALKELPAEPYQYAEWRARRVGLDYHVDIDGHYYSVPHRLIREQLDARITAHTIELFRNGERVAVHLRGAGRGRHTTIAEHMPS